MSGAQKPVYVSTLQQRIAELAREKPEMTFTSLAHLIDIFWLYEFSHPDYPSSNNLYRGGRAA